MQRSETRGGAGVVPDCAALHPGYLPAGAAVGDPRNRLG
jgi:hypothetical protein